MSCSAAGKKYFAYGNMTVVLGETFVTIITAQLMCLVLGGQKLLALETGFGGTHTRMHRTNGQSIDLKGTQSHPKAKAGRKDD